MVSLFFVRILVIFEVSRDMHLDLVGPDAHIKKVLIEIHILGPNSIGSGVVFDEVDFDLNNSKHGRFEHVFK